MLEIIAILIVLLVALILALAKHFGLFESDDDDDPDDYPDDYPDDEDDDPFLREDTDPESFDDEMRVTHPHLYDERWFRESYRDIGAYGRAWRAEREMYRMEEGLPNALEAVLPSPSGGGRDSRLLRYPG